LKPKILLDSGAFSVSKSKGQIDLQEYIKFIYKWMDYLEGYFVLDVINEAEPTWVNQRIMEDAGLKPIPVYHQATEIKYLHKCMDYEFFGMGGVGGKGYSFKEIVETHNKTWNIICDNNGYPKNKVHGFGITSPKIMLRFPFWSVDSTSWVINSRFGHVIIPRFIGSKPNYDTEPQFISVCGYTRYTTSPERYFNAFSPSERDRIFEYIESKGFKFGKSEFKYEDLKYKKKDNEIWAESRKTTSANKRKVEIIIESGISNDLLQRDELNAIYYRDLQNSLGWPRKLKVGRTNSIMF
jgi:hypothetical protein